MTFPVGRLGEARQTTPHAVRARAGDTTANPLFRLWLRGEAQPPTFLLVWAEWASTIANHWVPIE